MLTKDEKGLCSLIGAKHTSKPLQKAKNPSFNTKKVWGSAMRHCRIMFRENKHLREYTENLLIWFKEVRVKKDI